MKLLSTEPRTVRFALVAVLLCVVVLAYIEYSKRNVNRVRVLVSTPQMQSIDIGSYDNLEDGQRAAMQQLDRQMKGLPQTLEYQAHWQNQKIDKDFYLEYKCQSHQLELHVYTRSHLMFIPRFPFPFVRRSIVMNDDTGLDFFPKLSAREMHNATRENKTYDELFQRQYDAFIRHP